MSETSLKVGSENAPLPSHWLLTQGAQLDPGQIHYFVAPGALLRMGVRFGDVGIAYNAKGMEEVPFIVGDGGGLGEGSVSLLAALVPGTPPHLSPRTSALGEPVQRYVAGISGDFRFVVFPATARLAAGSSLMTGVPASGLPAWIDDTAKAALQARSSREEVLSCSGH